MIDQAFAEVERVHRLMSFHEAQSDISRLNRAAPGEPIEVDPHTRSVLSFALDLSQASDGRFDVTVGGRMVVAGRLPPPASAPPPDPKSSWRDIEILDDGRVRLHRRLWIDLGGVAKGYAVDLAVQALGGAPDAQWGVNAGGDLRTVGPLPERVLLRCDSDPEEQLAFVDLQDGALASSGGLVAGAEQEAASAPVHFDAEGRIVDGSDFAAVLAPRCIIADALTKVVLAAPDGGDATLKAFGATAFRFRPSTGWARFGMGEP